ncbi:MAG: type II toxin-antitoxin system VapC family toxin [Acidobacteria bacterium]|nr:type II toxin-antitoxin system VapC family toxin [Acidobacteriota bacterium]
MRLYAESSAILAWLLGDAAADPIRALLQQAELVITSDLTLVECDRALHRAQRATQLSEADAADRRAHLNEAAAAWHVLRLHPTGVERARRGFPSEPLETISALHLASALVARSAIPGLAVLALDEDVRRNAHLLGFRVVPATTPSTSSEKAAPGVRQPARPISGGGGTV